MPPPIVPRLLITAVVVLVMGAACGGGDTTRPPHDLEGITAIFEEDLAAWGLVVARASLIDTEAQVYTSTPDGNHLAIYVEPMEPSSPEEYAARAVDLAKLFVPRVFDEWSGLDSFDICQEPHPSVDGRRLPALVTILDVSREGAADIDWSSLTLKDLVDATAGADRGEGSVYFGVDDDVAATAAMQAASA